MDHNTANIVVTSGIDRDSGGDGSGIVSELQAIQSNETLDLVNNTTKMSLSASNNSVIKGSSASTIGEIQVSQLDESSVSSKPSNGHDFACKAIANRAIVPTVLQPVGTSFPADIQLMEACMHEMIYKSANGGGSVGAMCPSKTPQMLPPNSSFGFPNTTVASRVSSMFPLPPNLDNNDFANSCASVSVSFATSADLGAAVNEKASEPTKCGGGLDIRLVPEKRSILSDYNYILAENIEFFETPTSYELPVGLLGNMKELPTTRIGLRCIHCSSNGFHITAASFFPSSIASLSSGMGTIGSRHFLGGKCTFIPTEVVATLVSSKKLTQQQKKSRQGLDAYCKQIAKANRMRDHEIGGIFISRGPVVDIVGSTSNETYPDKSGKPAPDEANDSKTIASVVKTSSPPKDPIPNRKDPSVFVEGLVEHFWECSHCNSLPLHWRATGSVVFCAERPTMKLVGKHLSVCQGKKSLLIPRNANIRINGPSVLVQWSNDESKRKSSRTKRQSLGLDEIVKKKRKTVAAVPIENINRGVDNALLAVSEDKALTTDFAFFTVLQLKKCYLTKSGGSRGNCPLGYPGLACRHCAGNSNERRFFYTSADHLRNSFSHIPSHILSCVNAPSEVKTKIEENKTIRNIQKTQLKAGSHKNFIDLVWTKLHGEGGGAVAVPPEKMVLVDTADDEKSITSLSADFEFNPNDDYLHESLDGRLLESKDIAMETAGSALLSLSDRKLTTSYMYFALLQQMPQQYMIDSKGTLSKVGAEKKAIPTEPNIKTSEQGEGASTNPIHVDSIFTKPITSSDSGPAFKNADIEADTTPESDNEQNDNKEPYTFNTLVCKHCKNDDVQATFLPESAEHLRASFSCIPAHLVSCSKCPQSVKSKLDTLKALRPIQEALLKRKTQNKLMITVWNRIGTHFQPKEDEGISPELKVLQIPDFKNSEVLSTELLAE
eukprot:scaffold1340_cov277-Chaetoceros_neogracile.AAC.26